MTRKPKPDAMGALSKYFDAMCIASNDDARTAGRVFRRLVRALRVHERQCAANRAYQHGYDSEKFDVQTCERIRAAVLRPRARTARGAREGE